MPAVAACASFGMCHTESFVPAVVVGPEAVETKDPKPRTKRRAARRHTAAIEVEASGVTVRMGDGTSPAMIAAVTVTTCGRICYNRHRINLSQVFAGQTIGIKQTDDHIWLVSFMDYDLGYFDDETCQLEPLQNPFGLKVLPMSWNKRNSCVRNGPVNGGWGARIRTWEWRYQKPLPYRLATPQGRSAEAFVRYNELPEMATHE